MFLLKIKKIVWWFVQTWPFGSLCILQNDDGSTITLLKNYYVVVSDGNSSDALPITFISQKLVDRFEIEIRKKWYFVPPNQSNVGTQEVL